MATIVKRKSRKKVVHKKEQPLTYIGMLKLFAQRDKEYNEQRKEMDRLFKKESDERDRLYKERSDERDRFYKEKSDERDKKLKEDWALLKEETRETDRRMKELQGLFTTQWGKLVEALLGKGCLAIFKQRGIKITQSSSNVISAKDGKHMEIDVLLVNGEEAVVIEVKTTAKVSHVRALLEDMKEFKTFFPQYKSYKVYGALAALKFEQESHRFAASHGLFVVESTGEGLVSIKNTGDFKPKAF